LALVAESLEPLALFSEPLALQVKAQSRRLAAG
jgi:hypothetical protein